MAEKFNRSHWYSDWDVKTLLKEYELGNNFKVIDFESNDHSSIRQMVNEAFAILKGEESLNTIVMPINIGYTGGEIWQDVHWVGLVIKKTEEHTLKAFYADPVGNPIEKYFLEELKNHDIAQEDIIDFQKKQLSNDYDCGPWTVFNLDTIRKENALANVNEQKIIEQRSLLSAGKIFGMYEYPSYKKVKLYNSKGNEFLQQNKRDEAIKCYEKAIECHFFNPIPHYNKRFLENKSNEPIDDKLTLTPAKTNFVINTISYVPEHKFSRDSSGEDTDSEFESEFKKINSTGTSFPYTIKSTKKVNIKDIIEPLGDPELLECGKNANSQHNDFFEYLLNGGLKKNDKEKISDIAVSIALNRMKSLSERKNKSLCLEVKSKIKTEIRYEKFAFFWKCQWCDQKDNTVDYDKVKKFYKKLKNYDRKNNTLLAKEFLKQEEKFEKNPNNIPYQYLREYAKNHAATKKLIREFRNQNPRTNLYLSLIDDDVVHFDEIYSAYLRIVQGCCKLPDVMSTGYTFFPNSKYGFFYSFSSRLDAMIRMATAIYFPLGTYYPEPNMCALIPDVNDTIPESFIDIQRQNKYESPILLNNILKSRSNATFIFSQLWPIAMKTPSRMTRKKSPRFHTLPKGIIINGMLGMISEAAFFDPTEDEIKEFYEISQSNLKPSMWSNNLFINCAIPYKEPTNQDEFCYDKKGRKIESVSRQLSDIITKLHESEENSEEYNSLKDAMSNRLDSAIVNKIIQAMNTKKMLISYHEQISMYRVEIRTPLNEFLTLLTLE